MSMEIFDYARMLNADHIFVPTYPQEANGSGTVLDLATGLTNGGDFNGAGPRQTRSHYIRGGKYPSFGGDGTDYMDQVNDYWNTGVEVTNGIENDVSVFWIMDGSAASWTGTRILWGTRHGSGLAPQFWCRMMDGSGTTSRYRITLKGDNASYNHDDKTTNTISFADGPRSGAYTKDWSVEDSGSQFYDNGIAVATTATTTATLPDAATANTETMIIGAIGTNTAKQWYTKCGMGVLMFWKGTVLTDFQVATLHRLSKMFERPGSPYKRDPSYF